MEKRLHHFPSSYDSSSETSSDSDYDHNMHTAQHARASTTCLPGTCAMGYLVTPGLNEMADNSMSTKTKEWILGAVSIRKTVLLGMAIPMLKIRRPLGRLIFNMGIAIPGKTVFLIETAPWQGYLLYIRIIYRLSAGETQQKGCTSHWQWTCQRRQDPLTVRGFLHHGEGDRLICQQHIHKHTQTDQRPKSLTAWSKRSRAPSQYKDRLICVWRLPC